MGFAQAFRLAIKSLASSKMRSFLTMLGIIIGVGSVIILVSLMQGMTGKMTSTFEEMGTNRLTVSISGRGSSRTVDVDDMYALYDENGDVFSSMSPTVSMAATVKKGSDSDSYESTTVTGVSEQYGDIDNLELDSGRFLSYIDMSNRKKVCVVGSYIAQTAFGTTDAVGETIKLNGNVFTVVGVLTEQDDSTSASSDDCMYVPYTTASKLGRSRVSSFTFMTTSTDYNEEGTTLLDNALYEVFQSEDYYSISDMSEMLSTVEELTGTMTLVLVGIAAISLLVGGIGIMNIMLVSVTERTREIGVRKSLGAKRKDILRQFVIEAATTSAVGGLIGIVFGAGVAILIGKIVDLSVSPSVTAVSVSFGVSVAIGVFFGFMPASKASKLNPIDALRYD